MEDILINNSFILRESLLTDRGDVLRGGFPFFLGGQSFAPMVMSPPGLIDIKRHP
jgi:hypothetical protein